MSLRPGGCAVRREHSCALFASPVAHGRSWVRGPVLALVLATHEDSYSTWRLVATHQGVVCWVLAFGYEDVAVVTSEGTLGPRETDDDVTALGPGTGAA